VSSLARIRQPYSPSIVGVGGARVGVAPPAPPGKVATFTQPPDGRAPDVNYVGFSWWWIDDPSLPTAGSDDPGFVAMRSVVPGLSYEDYLKLKEPGADDPAYVAMRAVVPGLTYDDYMKSRVATVSSRCPGPLCIEVPKQPPPSGPKSYQAPPLKAGGTSGVTIFAVVAAAGAAIYYFFVR